MAKLEADICRHEPDECLDGVTGQNVVQHHATENTDDGGDDQKGLPETTAISQSSEKGRSQRNHDRRDCHASRP